MSILSKPKSSVPARPASKSGRAAPRATRRGALAAFCAAAIMAVGACAMPGHVAAAEDSEVIDLRVTHAEKRMMANVSGARELMSRAKGVLINITGGYDLTLFELDEAANRIRQEVDPEANIIVGSTLDPDIDGVMRVSVVATGIEAEDVQRETPRPVRRVELEAPRQAAPEAPAVAAAPAEPAPVAAERVEAPAPQPAADAECGLEGGWLRRSS